MTAALLAIPFFFLKANLADPSQVTWLDRLLLQASAPIQYLATQAARGVSGVVSHYVWLVDVRHESDRVSTENARLRDEVKDLEASARENQRLRELLGLREALARESLSAQVIGKEVSPFFRVMRLRLDRGERDLLRPGMPVVSAEGLVGEVRRTWGRYADVRLTADADSRIDVVIRRTGSRGMLLGTGGDDRHLCRIQYLQRSEKIEVGDEVYTSGLGMRFPAGVLVGKVSKIEAKETGLFQEVEVAPAVDFSDLQEVLILSEGSREQSLMHRGADDPSEPRE